MHTSEQTDSNAKPRCVGDSGGWRAASPSGTLQGAAFEGENLEFWRLHYNVLALSLYLFLIYSVHRGWVLPVGGARRRN